MRIAFTSSDGATIDEHFGMTRDFRIWEIGPEAASEVGTVTVLPVPGAPRGGPGPGHDPADVDEEDRIAARANAIVGCAIVYTVAIGGPAAAKLVARRIHPLKTGKPVPIVDVVAKLQEVLRGVPPPWLRKAMSGGAAQPADE